jgi:hypothetical protein
MKTRASEPTSTFTTLETASLLYQTGTKINLQLERWEFHISATIEKGKPTSFKKYPRRVVAWIGME